MRLFLWSRHPLIEIRSRDDSSLARYGASTGDLRIMRLRPFPEPARRANHRDTHDWHPFLNCRKPYMGTISNHIESILRSSDKFLGPLCRNWHSPEIGVVRLFNLIGDHHGLTAGFFAPAGVPSDSFLSGSLGPPCVVDCGTQNRAATPSWFTGRPARPYVGEGWRNKTQPVLPFLSVGRAGAFSPWNCDAG
jgi:hypothetical protein